MKKFKVLEEELKKLRMITILLLNLALIAHLLMDLHKQKVGHPIMHWISATVAVGVSVAGGFLNHLFTPEFAVWQFVFFSLSIHLGLFDWFWNICNHQNLFYQGDPKNPSRAWMDKLWSYCPPLGQIFIRPWIVWVGYSVYFHLDLIINN